MMRRALLESIRRYFKIPLGEAELILRELERKLL